MQRYKLAIEYDGRPFVGWQRQDNGPSVQAEVERAVAAFCGESRTVYGAGRTDAGVHALGQVAHVDIEKSTNGDTVRDALNFHLKGQPVSILAAEPVDHAFHARFSATGRAYEYRILNRRAPPSIDKGRVWHVPAALDHDAMAQGARHLVGRHDFTTFRAAQCQALSPVKTLDALTVERHGEVVRVSARARSFLHHQVRSMVGSLKRVGEGRWSEAEIGRALAARDRSAAGPTAPPDGLYLVSVAYGPTQAAK